MKAVPGNCNAVAIVRIRELVHSPLGMKGKWFDRARRAYAEGLLSGPPWVREIVQATTIGSKGQGRGEPLTFSIYSMDQASIISQIASHELAKVERVAGHGAVASSRNVFFIQLESGLVGAIQPSNRDAASQWVESLAVGKLLALSPNVAAALKNPDSAQVLLAVDLKGLLNPRYIQNWIVGTPKLRATDDIAGLAKLISSLQIARLSVRVSDTMVAELRLDFGSPIGNHTAVLEKALVQWLDDAGARMQVVSAAKTRVEDHSISFEVPLDEIGLRRLLNLIQSPHISPTEARSAGENKPNAVASAAYYNKVCDSLNSLVRKNRDPSGYKKTALWHEQAARKIDGISTIAVDPALVQWGRNVSKELVALARSLRGEAVELADLERSIRVNEQTTYRWYGYSGTSGPLYFPSWVSTDSNLELVRARQEAQVDKSAGQREEIWNMLYQQTAAVAKKMESTYRIKLKLPS